MTPVELKFGKFYKVRHKNYWKAFHDIQNSIKHFLWPAPEIDCIIQFNMSYFQGTYIYKYFPEFLRPCPVKAVH